MTKRFILCGALCLIATTVAFARGGGGGSHHSSGGASVAAPGTNSSGTALSSGGHGAKGAAYVTDPAIDREEAKVAKMIKSICRGC